MGEIQNKALKNSLNISIVYVGLGTTCLFAITSPALMENEIVSMLFMIPLLLAMPVTFIGFGILYGGGENSIGYALLAQVIVFVLFWFIAYLILVGRYKKKQKIREARSTDVQQNL